MDHPNWITPQDAERQVDEAIGPHAALTLRGRSMIISWLDAGQIQLEARRKARIWYRDNKPTGQPEVEGPCALSIDDWREADRRSFFDSAELRRRMRKPLSDSEYVFSGVRLSLDDLLQRMADAGVSAPKPSLASTGKQSQRQKGPQWKRFDEAVNLVALLLTSPQAPTDYSKSGAQNLARLVGEGKIRCRAGSLQKIVSRETICLDWQAGHGQAELRKFTHLLAEAFVLGAAAAVTGDLANTAKVIEKIRKSPNPVHREIMKQADDAVKNAGRRPEELFRSAIGLMHAFDDLSKLSGSDESGRWCVVKADRETSSYAISHEGDQHETIDVVGLQFSYSDIWTVLGEDPPDPEVEDDLPNRQNGSSKSKQYAQNSRKGRAKGTGYQRADAPLLEKMREAIASNPALNANSAAKLVADEAEGASFEAKVDRLARAFRAGRKGE